MRTKIFRRYQDAKRKEKAKFYVRKRFGAAAHWIDYYCKPRFMYGHYQYGPNSWVKSQWSREYRRTIRDELRKEEPQVFPFHKVTSIWDWY